MASNSKTALVFTLLLATVMAACACTNCPAPATYKHVPCKNEYCKPVIVNGITIEANVTVNVLVNATGIIELEVTNLLGQVVTGTYTCPSSVTALAIVQVDLGLEVQVVAAVTTSLVGSVLATLNVVLALCVVISIGL